MDDTTDTSSSSEPTILYLVTSPLVNAVKVGIWSNSVRALRGRYITYYGKNLDIYYFSDVQEARRHETKFKHKFAHHKIFSELFAKQNIQEYLDHFQEVFNKPFACYVHKQSSCNTHPLHDVMNEVVEHLGLLSVDDTETRVSHDKLSKFMLHLLDTGKYKEWCKLVPCRFTQERKNTRSVKRVINLLRGIFWKYNRSKFCVVHTRRQKYSAVDLKTDPLAEGKTYDDKYVRYTCKLVAEDEREEADINSR